MTKTFRTTMIVTTALGLTSCATFHHNVAAAYPDYLQQYATPPAVTLPTNLHYRFAESFDPTEVDVQPSMADSAHVWVIQPQAMLTDYLHAQGLYPAGSVFGGETTTGEVLVLDQARFRFEEGMAHVDLAVTLSRDSALVFSKQYSADGSNKRDRTILAAPWGTTGAILDSTTVALDAIFGQVAKDLSAPR